MMQVIQAGSPWWNFNSKTDLGKIIRRKEMAFLYYELQSCGSEKEKRELIMRRLMSMSNRFQVAQTSFTITHLCR